MYEGALPSEMCDGKALFEELWELHPPEFHEMMIKGQLVKTPRWQQAYGRDYVYSGSRNQALPVPELFAPYWDWVKETVDERLNGLLLNWYDGSQKHYIGKHRDAHEPLVDGSPIVTISFGGERVFRMRPWRGSGYTDFAATNGSVFVIPYDTNLAWTHEVPKSAKDDRRISITFRVFRDEEEE